MKSGAVPCLLPKASEVPTDPSSGASFDVRRSDRCAEPGLGEQRQAESHHDSGMALGRHISDRRRPAPVRGFFSLRPSYADSSGLLLLLSLGLLFVLPPTTPPHPFLSYLATFLGVSATLLAVLQYAPQIYKTYKAGLVGALSLGTMAIQVPGSVLFVVSLVLRPGTDWTSWLAYAVTGAMQGALLVS